VDDRVHTRIQRLDLSNRLLDQLDRRDLTIPDHPGLLVASMVIVGSD
jgi:hypothetical protein